jgi:hypothetical protein
LHTDSQPVVTNDSESSFEANSEKNDEPITYSEIERERETRRLSIALLNTIS